MSKLLLYSMERHQNKMCMFKLLHNLFNNKRKALKYFTKYAIKILHKLIINFMLWTQSAIKIKTDVHGSKY